ncbi:MAG TPA: hypothetical protein VKS22_17150 [Candidatus Binataceae bacterium]|nr:hypothetical protein [Candidatus Binataceae bacterium]
MGPLALVLTFVICAFYACQSRKPSAAAVPTGSSSPSHQAAIRLASVVAPPSAGQPVQAIKAALAVVKAADDAWNRGDAKAFFKNYSNDAHWTYSAATPTKLPAPNQVILQRQQLEQTISAAGFRFSPYKTTQTWISFPSANVAEVHSIIEFVNGRAAGPYVNGPVVSTLNNVNGTWTITHVVSGVNLIGHLDICGFIGAACCSGWVYNGSGIPQPIRTCESGAACNGDICVAGPTPVPCGGLGQDCCPDPDSNDSAYDFCTSVSDTVCYTWQGPHGTCEPCGAPGQGVCASNHCAAGAVARGGFCLACGAPGQPCCSNGCTDASVCSATQGYTCAACGIEGNAPCVGASPCTDDLHLDFQNGQSVCTFNCGHGPGQPCPAGSDECGSQGVIIGPQRPCEQPLNGKDLSGGGLYYCYNSMIDTFGNCTCVANTISTCPVSTSVPKPPAPNSGLCIQGQFTDISGHGC